MRIPPCEWSYPHQFSLLQIHSFWPQHNQQRQQCLLRTQFQGHTKHLENPHTQDWNPLESHHGKSCSCHRWWPSCASSFLFSSLANRRRSESPPAPTPAATRRRCTPTLLRLLQKSCFFSCFGRCHWWWGCHYWRRKCCWRKWRGARRIWWTFP